MNANWNPYAIVRQRRYNVKRSCHLLVLIIVVGLGGMLGGCASRTIHHMEVTAYSSDSISCNWERGSWKCLKLNFWDKYIREGKNKGKPYSGLTASGTKPHEPHPGFFSVDSIVHPWMIPIRIIFFPWLFLPEDGTVAADTRYYPFGTRMYIPGYGEGRVEDRGGAIKGPRHIDIYYDSRSEALQWGRQYLNVKILN